MIMGQCIDYNTTLPERGNNIDLATTYKHSRSLENREKEVENKGWNISNTASLKKISWFCKCDFVKTVGGPSSIDDNSDEFLGDQ